jgi:hypothetical protein
VVFVVNEQDMTVSLRPVDVGITDRGEVQLRTPAGEGESSVTELVGRRVVTLGQQLIGDGSAIRIPENPVSGETDKGDDAGEGGR